MKPKYVMKKAKSLLKIVTCNNTNYNSISNCKKCSNNNSCSFCQDEYTFINGNKSICIAKSEIEGKYIPDTNDTSNYIKCSTIINNCNLSLVCLLRHKRKQKRHSYMVPATNCQFPE